MSKRIETLSRLISEILVVVENDSLVTISDDELEFLTTEGLEERNKIIEVKKHLLDCRKVLRG